MTEGRTIFSRGNKLWIVVFVLMIIAIIGLSFAIIIIRNNHEQRVINEEQLEQISINNDANSKCSEINGLYDTGAIPFEIAEQYLANAADTEEVLYKISIIVCRAKFIYENGGDLARAIKVLDELEPYFNERVVKINYYTTMRDFYSDGGDNEKVNYYDGLINELNQEEEDAS